MYVYVFLFMYSDALQLNLLRSHILKNKNFVNFNKIMGRFYEKKNSFFFWTNYA